MTTRYNALVVVLEYDVRDDDVEPLINAIRMMRGVASVSGNVASIEEHAAEARVRSELSKKLFGVLYGEKP